MSTAAATPTVRASLPVVYQMWRDLLFIHWRVPAETLTGKLPAGLSVDTWQGDSWIGLVAFRMQGIRPHGLPPAPKSQLGGPERSKPGLLAGTWAVVR